jgi:hypothetical protein
MIDASRSPRPRWKQLTMLTLLIAAVVISAWLIWVKELHHPTQIHVFSTLTATSALSGALVSTFG